MCWFLFQDKKFFPFMSLQSIPLGKFSMSMVSQMYGVVLTGPFLKTAYSVRHPLIGLSMKLSRALLTAGVYSGWGKGYTVLSLAGSFFSASVV